jgi:hypothetical protein
VKHAIEEKDDYEEETKEVIFANCGQLNRCGLKTTRILFKQRLLKDNPDNVCLAFAIKSPECEEELKRADSLEFNMFRLRDMSGGNELVLTTMNILLREKVFS